MASERRIGIRELRQHASRWVGQAEQGHRIEITNHGRLVAALVPATADDPIAALERTGQLTRATHGWDAPPERVVADDDTATALREQRDRDRTR